MSFAAKLAAVKKELNLINSSAAALVAAANAALGIAPAADASLLDMLDKIVALLGCAVDAPPRSSGSRQRG